MIERQESRIDNPEKGILVRILKGTGITLGGKIFGGSLRYISCLVTAWILGIDTFGLFFLGLAVINLCGSIVRFGMDNAVVRYVAIYQGEGEKGKLKGVLFQCLFFPVISSLIIGGILLTTSDHISAFAFSKPGLAPILKVLSVSLPFFSFMMVATFACQGFQRMKYSVSILNLYQPGANILFTLFIFFVIGSRLNSVLFAYLLSIILAAVLSFYYLKKIFPEITSRKLHMVFETKNLLRFSIPTFMAGFMVVIIFSIDSIMLGYWRDTNEVGIYNAATKTALMVSAIGASIGPIFSPIIADLHNKGKMDWLDSIFKTTTRWSFGITVPVFVFMTIFSKEIMGIFGQKFLAGWISLIILAFAQMFGTSTGFTGGILLMSGKQNVTLYNSIVVCITNVALNCLLIPSYGFVGAAISTSFAIILYNLLMLIEVYLIFHIFPFDLGFLRVFLICVISGLIIYFMKAGLPLHLHPFVYLAFFVFISIIIFGIALYFSGSIEQELSFLKSIKRGTVPK